MRKKSKLYYITHYIMMLIILAFVLLPFYWMFITSIKPAEELFLIPPKFVPSEADLSSYEAVLTQIPFFTYLKNSIIVASATTIVAIIVSSLSAFALARFKFRYRKQSFALFIITQLVPGVLPIVPFYFMLYKLGLTNSYVGLVLSYGTWSIAFSTMMLQSYFRTAYSTEIEESARIDGCNSWGVFTKIALPLAKPGIVATGIFAFLIAWNDYIWASIINTNDSYRMLSNGIQDFQAQYGNAYIDKTMAIGFLSTIPVLIIFLFVQNNLTEGLTAGAVKG